MTRPLARSLARVIQLPPPARGQFGPNHTVVEVLKPDAWVDQDPFILLMDDRLDGRLVAGPHPHAGFETVTFPLDDPAMSSGRRRAAVASLSEAGLVTVPFALQFWGDHYGNFTDRFGVQWAVGVAGR